MIMHSVAVKSFLILLGDAAFSIFEALKYPSSISIHFIKKFSPSLDHNISALEFNVKGINNFKLENQPNIEKKLCCAWAACAKHWYRKPFIRPGK